ncbi:MAG: F0F1 ATP synthase subunit A, partial [Promethearchaeota archaeon]
MSGAGVSDSLEVVADSLQHAGKSDSGWILHHIMDERVLNFGFFQIHIPQFPLIFGIDLTPTKHTVFMWLSALLVFITFSYVASRYKKSLIPKGIANLFEVLVIFVRDEIVKPTIGNGYQKFLPSLLTFFFFILFGNFLGLIPFSSTFTSNIAATGALALMSFIIIQVGGMQQNGVFGYWK